MGTLGRIRDAWLTLNGRSRESTEFQRLDKLVDYYSDLRRSFGAHYDSGQSGRLQGDWGTTYDTHYSNLCNYRSNLIARSIHACDNDPYAKAIRETIVSDVVKNGIRPRARIKFTSGELVFGLNKLLDDAWERYNDQWDASGHSTFLECQQTALREIFTSGAVITNRVSSTDSSPYLSTATQMVSVLRLDTSHDSGSPSYSQDPHTAQTVWGINIDANGRPRSYWIQGIDKPISAQYMRQTFKRVMAEEYTSVPWMTAALAWMWANRELIKDRLIASRFQSMVAMMMPDRQWASMASKYRNSDNQMELKSGRVYPYDPTAGKPEIMQADDFIKDVLIPLQRMLLHGISVSFGWSYQTITRDVTEINQAAGRINTNRDRAAATMIQRWFSKEWCQPEWEWFVYRAFLEGKIPGKSLSDYLADPWRYNQCQWQAPGMQAIDPAKEANAADVSRKNRMLSLSRYYSETYGTDWRDELDQIAEEEEYCNELGIEPLLEGALPAIGGGEDDAANGDGDSQDGGSSRVEDEDGDAQGQGR